MKILKYIILISGLTLVASSCSKWIDVKPADRLGEEQLFVNRAGFMKAINGVYVEMASTDLYGQHMSTGIIDVLAQYYYINGSTHVFDKYNNFVYTEASVKSGFEQIWKKAYELIANCNVILDKCGNAPSEILPQPYFGIIKGEALALRAMIHLDMLRLFGPIYSEDNKYKPALPYIDKISYDISPLLGSEEFTGHVVADLEAGLLLLQDSDPIRTEGVRNQGSPTGENDLYYRQYRLNYYAVKALLARTYLWMGDRTAALKYAEELLTEVHSADKMTFPFVTFASAVSVDKPDRMFSTEVMFSLYNINRKEMYNRLFDVSLQSNNKLSFSNGDVNDTRVRAIYDDNNDFRRRIWQSASNGTTTATTNMKYADVINGPGRYMIPLIRLSEVLLIAAECSPELTKATAYFNSLRTARNCVSLAPVDQAALKAEITKEFRREMLGEGQQFFYYKRNAMQALPNSSTLNISPERTMVLTNYTVPLPDSETSQRY
ncbi:RagB/SusD family nutrient uptake outer membrane protein [Sphingobacterium sp. UBA5996]|uniref:RagB/SusD family nutrient uptake outer membrane protein n=1 Tax=Sphingobacterium sp. UBA5996 TaxID=1947505 RepID=UPI0025D115FE|nr:RagB/SusD family nutrient uptake outer membrane protein [Sphingobacterium sp. UBA5996]